MPDVAVAVLLIVVPRGVSGLTETIRVTLALLKAVIVPKLAVTVLPSKFTLPWLAEALTKVVCWGMASVSTTFDASSGPPSVTTML